MVRFGFGKKREVLDLSERYHQQQEKIEAMREEVKEEQTTSSGGMFGFLGNIASNASSSESSSNYLDDSESTADKKKRLIKRIMDMSSKLEELSNSIYHLEQRIDVLEKKSGTNMFN
ncbi:hypothetical protein ISS08_01175 [Candidatus Pacearchaeota archaeon]|nr:hypothetical protein [Candidatus Pacearchaeota archaeon]